MSYDEGYIKYDSHWRPSPPPLPDAVPDIERWRHALHAAGLIGYYADLDVGYGNISVRAGEPGQFLISGTQTGHLEHTDASHYALVTGYDIAANQVHCRGPLQASSEAMTHAAIYELDDGIKAIVHAHSRDLWEQSRGQLPTTNPKVAYGTPAMAQEFGRLYRETDFRDIGVAVMAGHEEGIVSIGATLAEATRRMLSLVSFSPPVRD